MSCMYANEAQRTPRSCRTVAETVRVKEEDSEGGSEEDREGDSKEDSEED